MPYCAYDTRIPILRLHHPSRALLQNPMLLPEGHLEQSTLPEHDRTL